MVETNGYQGFQIILDPILNNQCDFVWGIRFQHNSAKNMQNLEALHQS